MREVKRAAPVGVRLNPEEKRWLEARAQAAGMTPHGWLKAMYRWGRVKVEEGKVPPWEEPEEESQPLGTPEPEHRHSWRRRGGLKGPLVCSCGEERS
jgi:hypothetical protein